MENKPQPQHQPKADQPMAGKGIQIKAKDDVLSGKYANVAQINHNKEEFILDFMSVFPPAGTLNCRIIMSPGHYKRMIKAMQNNLQKYESRFGSVEESDAPETVHGFPVK